MNKKNNFINNKKNNSRNNNNNHNGHPGFHGGRGGNNNRGLNQWNQRLLMQRICDGAIVTLLSNAIAAASSVTTSKCNTPHTSTTNPGPSTSPTKEQEDSKQETCDAKPENSSSPSQENGPEIPQDKNIEEQRKNKCSSFQNESQIIQNASPAVVFPPQISTSTAFENPLLQTFMASILHNQLLSNRKCDKGTQTIERIVTPSPNLIRTANNISAGFQQQQQLINNTFFTSNYKFHGLAKTSSVYFTRGIR